MDKEASIEALRHVLADTYLLAIMTQNAHWNMEGPSFISLHKLFEEQYKDLAEMVDEIAERLRALGDYSPASMRDFLDLARLEESSLLNEELDALNTLTSAYQKLSILLAEHIAVIEQYKDAGTVDLFTVMIRHMDKQAWLLNSHL